MNPDVIVIGAGHNGLTAACYLRRAGLSVTVLEAAPDVGGMTSTEAIIESAPGHWINKGALDATFIHATDIVQTFDLARFGYREVWVDPIWLYLHPGDECLAIWRDPQRTADEIRKFAPADADAYLHLCRTLDAMLDLALPLMLANPVRPGWRALIRAAGAACRNLGRLNSISALSLAPCAEYIDGHFRHPVVRDALGSICSAFGPIVADGTGMIMIALGWYLRHGASRPVGGTQALPNALRDALVAMGGQVRCGAEVEQVLIENGRAVGVQLLGGEVLKASRAVLATCDPRTALTSLLPSGSLNAILDARAAAIPAYGDGIAPFKVDLALSGRLSLARYEQRRGDDVDLRQPGIYMGGLEAATAAETAAARGQMPQIINLYAGIPTSSDPSQAPDGQDTLWMYAHPMPVKPSEPWASLKPLAGDAIVARISEFIDGVREQEIGRNVESADDLARRFRATAGCLWHVDLSLTRLGPMRPARGLSGYSTPIKGFYLGSAGSHPTPGMSGLPGKLASEEILRRAEPR